MKAGTASLVIAAAFSAMPLRAQPIITSPEPEAVSLTIYRDAGRGSDPIDAEWPSGYALITETRTVQIPAGEALLRFEGVAEGMFPESAIVTGLPKGVREKNRDARLLSPSGLVDAYLKRAVTITRTNRKSGKVSEQQAMITAGPDGGVILQTDNGYEALRCTGLPERMAFGSVPSNLSAQPTLSVITSSDKPVAAQLTLTYMAGGFDWQANYIADVDTAPNADDGKENVRLFAWMTLANGGNQSFLNANTMAIAGKPNREANNDLPAPIGGGLSLSCWPEQRTHQVPFRPGSTYQPPPTPVPLYDDEGGAADIIVTARRAESFLQSSPVSITAITAAQLENLGDLKLYRIPEPVDVNAKGQKQVALLSKPGARFNRIYADSVDNLDVNGDAEGLWIRFKVDNKEENGLGLPLPSGQVAFFENSDLGRLYIGDRALEDRAVGDEIALSVGTSTDVRAKLTKVAVTRFKRKFRLIVSNALGAPANVEIEIPYELRGAARKLPKVDGVPTWKVLVPAHGEASLEYELKLSRERNAE